MYNPQHFEIQSISEINSVIDQFPFATVITAQDGEPFVNHLPLVREGRKILGHMSKRNPQWQHLKMDSRCKIIFHGPHAYINPEWYQDHDVPTWNYTVVHIDGKASLIADTSGIIDILKKTTDHMNRIHSDQWTFGIPVDLPGDALAAAIIGFEIEVLKVEGKFKLSQNRSLVDRKGVIDGLGIRTDDFSHMIGKLMAHSLNENK